MAGVRAGSFFSFGGAITVAALPAAVVFIYIFVRCTPLKEMKELVGLPVTAILVLICAIIVASPIVWLYTHIISPSH